MTIAPDPVPIRLSAPAEPPARPGFPVVAVLAPVGVSAVIFAVTRSPLALLFALVGPMVALSGLAEGRRRVRQAARRDRERRTRELEGAAGRIRTAQVAERERLARLAPAPSEAPWDVAASARLPIRVALGTARSGVEIIADEVHESDPLAERIETLRVQASGLPDAALVADLGGGARIIGAEPLARAVARALALQVAGRLTPADTRIHAPGGESWSAELPHGIAPGVEGEYRFERPDSPPLVIAWAGSRAAAPCPVTLRLGSGPRDAGTLEENGLRSAVSRPIALSGSEARTLAREVRRAAEARGIRAAPRGSRSASTWPT